MLRPAKSALLSFAVFITDHSCYFAETLFRVLNGKLMEEGHEEHNKIELACSKTNDFLE